MSSTVLARKYRPRNFESLVGQAHVVQALANALAQQRLHHAYLFTGTRGVGKTTIARILAKSLNCERGVTATPCGVCAACTDIDAGRFVDLLELDAASNTGIDNMREILDNARYAPTAGRYKVYLIDEVHMLSTTAFNAMLKTLEEPPEYLKFILATTDPQKVPATVLSRCLQFNLRPMAIETIVGHLQAILAAEGVEAEPPALKLIARAARGSMRDAQSLADQAIAFGSGRIEEAAVRQMLGAVDRSQAIACTEAVAARDGAALVAAVDRLRELGLSAAGALEEMASLLQEMAVVQAVPAAAESADPDAADAIRLGALLPADETQLLYSIVLAGRAELPLAPDEYSGLVMVLLRMLAFAPAGSDGAPVASGPTSAAQARPAAAAAPRSQPAVAAPVAAATLAASTSAPEPPRAAIDPGRVIAEGTAAADLWCALVARLVGAGAIQAMVRELAMQAECVRVIGDGAERTWHVRVERENLRTQALRERLQAAASEAEGHPVRLELEAAAVADTPAARDAAERERRQAAAERAIEEDPLVRALMSQYKTARIVPGSVKPLPAP